MTDAIVLAGARILDPATRTDRVTPDFVFASRPPRTLECAYCGGTTTARFAASKLEGRFHAVGSAYAKHVLDANLVLFASRAEAVAGGFESARRARGAEEDV